MTLTKSFLERAYRKYNRPEFIHPDPLEFVHEYKSDRDKEVVGLIASSLAFGRVRQILGSVRLVLDAMGSPSDYVESCTEARARRLFKGFKHRFVTGDDLGALLFGMKAAIASHGSLNQCFLANSSRGGDTVQDLAGFVRAVDSASKSGTGFLLPTVSKGSACKRLCLYLRWMVRRDGVDPGCWTGVSPRQLIIPLDTHMYQLALLHGLTQRKNAGMKTALEITQGFARFSPKDPTKYDFALTRPGIWGQ